MKILILGDLHLREFWKDPVSKWDGNIIFLGDYVDPYPFEFPDGVPDPLIGLQEVFDFADSNRDRVTMLLGNHDHSYLYDTDASRHDHSRHEAIKEIFSDYLDLLSIAKQVDDCLFTHAGVSVDWLKRHDLELPEIDADLYLNKIFNNSPSIFWEMSWLRGGWENTGSPIWRDIREGDLDERFFQVYGHTMLTKPYITDKEACLDVQKAFVINTKTHEIKEFIE